MTDALYIAKEVELATKAYQDLKSTEEREQPEGSTGFLQTNRGKSHAQILSPVKGCVADALGDIRTLATTALAKIPRLETTQHTVVLPNLFSEGERVATVHCSSAGTEADRLIEEARKELTPLLPPNSEHKLNLEASLWAVAQHPACRPPKDNSKRCFDATAQRLSEIRDRTHLIARQHAEREKAQAAHQKWEQSEKGLREKEQAKADYEVTQMQQRSLPKGPLNSDEEVEMFFLFWAGPNKTELDL